MGFLDIVAKAKTHLRDDGRVSLRGLRREFDLEDEALAELVDELVTVQRVALREGDVLAWIGSAPATRDLPPDSAATAPHFAAEAERRQLTVMFCDLVGSTDLSQRLDAEDLREVMRAYYDCATERVEHYDGHVAQYLGDGLLVYFGYPQAHEDDAERAVRAGRGIVAALGGLNETLAAKYGVELSVRIGVHTGSVVVGEVGGHGRTETLALGDTANIAARLERVAEGDSVVISDATLRLISGLFVTQSLGTPQLKGVRSAIQAHLVLQPTGIRSRLERDPGRLTPLVGRDQEVGLVLARWERAQTGQGQAVFVSGEAGLGKSRLLQAFRERLSGEAHSWLECRCSPYTQASAFHPFIELLTQGLRFRPDDAPEARIQRLERGIELAGLSASAVVPLMAPLLSLPLPARYAAPALSADTQRKQTLEALVAWILALGEHQPLVLFCEDLHWCDPSTVELLGLLLERIPDRRLLMLLTFRLEFEPPWASVPHLSHLRLERLSRPQAVHMLGRMTGEPPLPDEVVSRIVAQADGIPLFVEEIAKMVLESKLVEERDGRYETVGALTDLAIPATLQDSLMARLDRIGEGKEVAQLGAVLGREFSYPLLRSVSLQDRARLDRGLAQLVDAELLYRHGGPQQTVYRFKHAMIQDLAYGSLLKSARQQLHARVARVLEERFPARVESEPEVVARHYDEADLPEPAIAHYQRAGARAAARSANEEAIRQLQRALELLQTLPELPERDRQELELQLAIGGPLSSARGWADPECEGAFERARTLASRIGEVPDLPRILVGLSVSYYSKGDLLTSAELADQALDVASRKGDSIDLIASHAVVGIAQFWQGEFARAAGHFGEVELLYDPREHAAHAKTFGGDRGVLSRAYASWCHTFLGYFDRALAESQAAAALAKQVGDPYSTALALGWSCVLSYMRRERQPMRERAEAMLALGDQLDVPLLQGLGKVYHGWAVTVSPEGEGVAELQQGLAELARHATGIGAPSMLAMLAEVFRKVGRYEDALGAIGVGAARAQEKGQHYYDAELCRLRGEILLEQSPDAIEQGEALFGQALEIARRQQTKYLELRAACSLARLLHRTGRTPLAHERLAPVYGWFNEGFDTADLRQARTLLDPLAS